MKKFFTLAFSLLIATIIHAQLSGTYTINSNASLTVANPLALVTTDIDDDPRGNTPCAGADEYTSGVNLPPVVQNPVGDIVFEQYPQTLHVNLDGVATDPDDPDENITYTLVANSNEQAIAVEINDKTLTIDRLNEEEATAYLTLRATSNDQYVDFNIHVTIHHYVGLRENNWELTVYPNPTQGQVSLKATDGQGLEYAVYNAMGQTVLKGNALGEPTTLGLSPFGSGIYHITVLANGNRATTTVIVR